MLRCLLFLMQVSHGGLTHEALMKMPYRLFIGYLAAAIELVQQQKDNEPNWLPDALESWKMAQPPPGGR